MRKPNSSHGDRRFWWSCIPRLSGGRIVAQALQEEGAGSVYSVIGTQITEIFDALYDTDIKTVDVRHENSAAIMADVHGRLVGEPGVCLVIGGPGATNSVTGVAHAFSAGSPMVHISGDAPFKSPIYAHHTVEDKDYISKVFQPFTKMSAKVRTLREISPTLSRGFNAARTSPRAPVHIDIATDILEEMGDAPEYRRAPVAANKPDPAQLRLLLKALKTAERPVLYFGDDVTLLTVRDQARRLVELVGAPVGCSLVHATGLISQDHPLYFGPIGPRFDRHQIAAEILKDADLVVTVGLRLGAPESLGMRKATSARIISIVPGASRHRELLGAEEVVGDTADVVKALAKGWAGGPRKGAAERRIEKLVSSHEATLDKLVKESERRPMHPALAMRELSKHIEEDAIISGDAGSSRQWLIHCVLDRTPCQYLDPGEFGAMGWAVPAAIAAKIIRPRRQAIAVCGDGDFLMAGNELSTAMKEKANAVTVILNDSKYGMIWLEQRLYHRGRHIGADVYTPSFAAYAESFGGVGITVDDPQDLGESFERALSSKKPAIIDIRVDHSRPYPSGDAPHG